MNNCAVRTVVGANLCIWRVRNKSPLGQRSERGIRYKEACTARTVNVVSQRQCFLARCLSSYVVNVFGLHSTCVCFPSTSKFIMWARRTVWLRALYHTVHWDSVIITQKDEAAANRLSGNAKIRTGSGGGDK